MLQPDEALEKLGARSILLVEDLILNQRLVKHIVEGWGFTVDIADNGAIALEMLQQKEYDLVLMDIQMPIMDGVEATKNIRSWQNEKSNIPIIAVTANSHKDDVIKYRAAGIDDLVEKPVDEQKLFAAIRNILQKDVQLNEADSGLLKHSAQDPVYSLEMIQSYSEDEAFLKEMVGMFVNSIPEYTEQLSRFCIEEDWVQLEKTAHKIKGAAGYFKVELALKEIAVIRNYHEQDKRSLIKATERLTEVLEFCAELMRREIL